MNRLSRVIYLCCMLSGGALVVAGVGLQIQASRAQWRGSLSVERDLQSFGDRAPGSEFVLSYTLLNETNQEVQILGALEHCRLLGCLGCDDLPLTIAAGKSAIVPVKVRLIDHRNEPTEFEDTLVLYTNVPGQTTLTLRITGRIVPLQEPRSSQEADEKT